MEDRLSKALELSERLLEDIETEALSVSSVALRCLRLARMMNDQNAVQWLEYETAGYPKSKTNTLESNAFLRAYDNGRKIATDDDADRRVFSDLADELESTISAKQSALQSFKHEGVSVAGEWAMGAMSNYTSSISSNVRSLTESIRESRRRLTVLRGQYYRYTLAVYYELRYSGRVAEIFNTYRENVDKKFINLAPEALRKLDTIYSSLSSGNPESWSHSLTTCRRLIEDITNSLFRVVVSQEFSGTYKTKGGKTFDVSGDKYLNRLYAIVDRLSSNSSSHALVGSNVIYVADWIASLNSVACKGVHAEVSYDEAMRAVIHTYICLGDLAVLAENV